MGNPVNFDGVNVVLRAATGEENVQNMGAFRNHAACVSCWELDREEIEEITRTGRVFLSVLMGGSQPPVAVGSETRIRGLMLDFGPVWPAPVNTPPEANMDGVQALLNSLDRTAIAKIVDPSAWINEGGYEIEQDHSGTSLHVADQIITYVLQKARSLATTEGQDNG